MNFRIFGTVNNFGTSKGKNPDEAVHNFAKNHSWIKQDWRKDGTVFMQIHGLLWEKIRAER
jgi:hypothetical protein